MVGNIGRPLVIALYGRQHHAARLLLESGEDIYLELTKILYTATHGAVETLDMLVGYGMNRDDVQRRLAFVASAAQRDKLVLLPRGGAGANGPPDIQEPNIEVTPLLASIRHKWHSSS